MKIYIILLHIIPIVLFITSFRFKETFRQRKISHEKIGIKAGQIHWRNFIFVAPKILSYYIYLSFWPSRLGFFHEFGKKEDAAGKKLAKYTQFWLLCLCLIGVFIWWGWSVEVVYWVLFMGLWSQFIMYGQFIAERYTYIPNVFFCVMMVRFLSPCPILYWILASLYFYRSHIYIPAWKHNINLFSYSVSSFPGANENYNNLGRIYKERGELNLAIKCFLLAIKYNHDDPFNLYLNTVGCYNQMYEYDKALHYLQKALLMAPPAKRTELKELESRLIFEVKQKSKLLRRLRQ